MVLEFEDDQFGHVEVRHQLDDLRNAMFLVQAILYTTAARPRRRDLGQPLGDAGKGAVLRR